MPKYYYKPLQEVVETTLLGPSFADGEYANTVLIVVNAQDEQESYELGKAIINLADWELSHVEE